MKNIAGLTFFLIILVVVSVFIAPRISGSNDNKNNNQTLKQDVEYFDDNAPVMYFWQEYCGYCRDQKKILQEISNQDNLKVKSMDVGNNQEFKKQYNIEGTPTFIAPDGSRLEGFQKKEALVQFLQKYQK